MDHARRTSVHAIVVSAALLATLAPLHASAAPPTAQETATFNAIRTRIAAHNPSAPKNAASALQTFAPGCWTSTVPCPAGGEITCVKYTVCTELVAWSAAAAGGEQGGAYIWDSSPDITIEDGCKVIVMNNQIMIDEPALTPGEGDAIGQTVNEALVYHELMHAQLGIEALSTPEIVTPVCQCAGPNPAARSDAGHTVVPGLQDGYIVSVGALNGANVQVLRIQAPASGAAFAIQLPVAKPTYTISVVQPENGNVSSVTVGDRGADGKVPISGTLTDPAKGGSIIVLVDPPALWQVVYVDLVPGPTPSQRRSWGGIKTIYR
jgi:hypothetical protein